jgi:hypothetical protein
MGKYRLGQRVKMKTGETGTIAHVFSYDAYQVKLDNGQLDATFGDKISTGLPCSPADFFKGQRTIVHNMLEPTNCKDGIDDFKKEVAGVQKGLKDAQKGLKEEGGYTTQLEREVRKDDDLEGSDIVFIGLKSLSKKTLDSIQTTGLKALGYSKFQGGPDAARDKFPLDQPRDKNQNIDQFRLLTTANSHKSGGSNTSTSGFQSASTDPSYAASFSNGLPEKPGARCYNVGLAVKITDKSYPLAIRQAVDDWNSLSEKQRGGKGMITLAHESTNLKNENGQTADFESEILLGGGISSDQIVYLVAYEIKKSLSSDAKIKPGDLQSLLKEKFSKDEVALGLVDDNNNNNSTSTTTTTLNDNGNVVEKQADNAGE